MQFAIGWNVAPDPRAVVGLEFTQGLAYARRQLPDSSGGWRMPDVTDVSDRSLASTAGGWRAGWWRERREELAGLAHR